MADVFNRASDGLGGSFAADAARVVFATGGAGAPALQAGPSGGVGLLTQNFQTSYAQQITRLYEIGSNLTFLVAGRTQGNLSMARIMGPRPVQVQFYKNYGDVCHAAVNNITLQLSTGCSSGSTLAQLNVGLFHCVIASIGTSLSAQDMIVNEQLGMIFVSMTNGG